MSHNAHVYCKNCNLYSEDDFKWNAINDLLKLYVKILRKNHKKLNKFLYSLEIEYYKGISGFINEHINHNIYIHGEYRSDPQIKL